MSATGKVAAVIQARLTSSRLPGKILLPLAGAPLLRRMVERVQRIDGVDAAVVALAEGTAHDAAVEALSGIDVLIVRGSEDDVLARTAKAARAAEAETVMRITSDCPLLDPDVSALVLRVYQDGRSEGLQYARTAFDRGYPLGFDTEVFSAKALYEAEAEATDRYEREHATPFIWRRPDRFPTKIVDSAVDHRDWRLVVDTKEDYELVSAIYDALYPANPAFGYADMQRLFAARPDLLRINAHVPQNPYVGLS
jgi:spore coat polysaccharide biosynthesis protein SpsF